MQLNATIRSYPVAFGLRILRFLPELRSGSTGCPPLPATPEPDAPTLFMETSMGPDNWSEAKLFDAVRYVRGSIHLRCTDRWYAVLPKQL